jgi:hypothetical protein
LSGACSTNRFPTVSNAIRAVNGVVFGKAGCSADTDSDMGPAPVMSPSVEKEDGAPLNRILVFPQLRSPKPLTPCTAFLMSSATAFGLLDVDRVTARYLGVVEVGITVAHDPLRGSGRAGLPHPALASGSDAKEAVQRIRMIDVQSGQPAVNQPPHPVPVHVAVLTAPR